MMEGRVRSFLKTPIPGYIPEDFITANERRFVAADISNPKEFSKRVGVLVT